MTDYSYEHHEPDHKPDHYTSGEYDKECNAAIAILNDVNAKIYFNVDTLSDQTAK